MPHAVFQKGRSGSRGDRCSHCDDALYGYVSVWEYTCGKRNHPMLCRRCKDNVYDACVDAGYKITMLDGGSDERITYVTQYDLKSYDAKYCSECRNWCTDHVYNYTIDGRTTSNICDKCLKLVPGTHIITNAGRYKGTGWMYEPMGGSSNEEKKASFMVVCSRCKKHTFSYTYYGDGLCKECAE